MIQKPRADITEVVSVPRSEVLEWNSGTHYCAVGTQREEKGKRKGKRKVKVHVKLVHEYTSRIQKLNHELTLHSTNLLSLYY